MRIKHEKKTMIASEPFIPDMLDVESMFEFD